MSIFTRTSLPAFAFSILLALFASNTVAEQSQPWVYKSGAQGALRQANFCDNVDAALEIAEIFVRFGAPTGYSALANSPSCSTQVQAVTPIKLLREVLITLENGDSYVVRFIEVKTKGNGELILVTTREFIQE